MVVVVIRLFVGCSCVVAMAATVLLLMLGVSRFFAAHPTTGQWRHQCKTAAGCPLVDAHLDGATAECGTVCQTFVAGLQPKQLIFN